MDTENLTELEYLSKKYDETNIPLYLSYPTTSFWKDDIDGESCARAFRDNPPPFLYFHFPYCKTACYYCCCYKTVSSDDADKDRYIAYLEKELKLKMKALGRDRLTNIRHMHWGGGTPTTLSCGQIERAFSSISRYAELSGGEDSSLSIEAYPDPDTLTGEKLALLRRLGFNELSLGVQDFDARIQKTINRDNPPETVKGIVRQARGLGFRIHIDLCYGLPFQGLNELERTIAHVLEMGPDRIAAFPYAHYPLGFPLQRKIPASSLPNSFIKGLLIRHASGLLAEAGYGKVGIDHFVRKDNRLCAASREKTVIKDFMGYSVGERGSFLGFGASAIGFSGRAYHHNSCSLEKYFGSLDRGEWPLEAGMAHALTEDDRIRGELILRSVLCDFSIDKERIGTAHGIRFDEYFREELAALSSYQKDGLVTDPSGDVISVTPEGRYAARHIAHVFDAYYSKRRTV
jgi:oxygen-independent coproporphyrinogen III oxidase